jgi:hypothetical protein
MTLAMTEPEREAFLAELHVGVISIERADGPPLAVPIWYGYEPRGLVWVITNGDSVKGRLLRQAGRFSLCAQSEEPPFYKYVSVEGPIVDVVPAELETDSRPMAYRYFGQEIGDVYLASIEEQGLKFSMRPERWWTVDYAKLG